ncbi:MAG TPA: hypothetical protein VGK73_23185 [Polyangiaceae bacterium]
MSRMSRLSSRWALLAGLASLGCGAEFDRVSEIESLRVFGVQKSAPYAQPGETVSLSLSFFDGSPQAVDPETLEPGEESPRKVQVAWLAGCFNPPGDLYAGCFATPPEDFVFQFGTTFDLPIPEDAILERSPPSVPYGLTYVFFAVCAGELGFDTTGADGLPLRCRDPEGRDLGSNDFVAGYSAIYIYGTNAAGEPYRNANPLVTGFTLSGVELDESTGGEPCVNGECLADCSNELLGCVTPRPREVDCTLEGAPCVPACADDGDSEKCKGWAIKPLVDPSSAEIDEISRDVYARPYEEQMWINYYATRGAVKSDARLLNDATEGWNGDYGTEFFAPSTPGPVRVWAVVHDNRGGQSWVEATIQVQ